jgi:hypothetical protein
MISTSRTARCKEFTLTSSRPCSLMSLYIEATNELVVARFYSAEKLPAALLDGVLMPMTDAIAERLD